MVPAHCLRSLLAGLALGALALTACNTSDEEIAVWENREFTVVDLDPAAAPPLQLAVAACAGLHNREAGGSIYIHKEAHDAQWLDDLGLAPLNTVDATTFLNRCLTAFPSCVRYDYAGQQRLLPNILTVAAALEAVPLDQAQTASCGTVAFDATVELAALDTPYLATQYVFDNFAADTTGLAMLNPGYATDATDQANPPLTGDMGSALVDYVFSQKLFVVFLVNACRASSPERELLSDIVNAGRWSTPVGVYGYNNSWLVAGGYYYEAQTLCLDSANMGAIPTMTDNLSYFSTRRSPITSKRQLARSAPEAVEYDPQKTYVAFVVGDGDNVRFIMTTRYQWLSQRLADCAQAGNPCEPLTWSISSHLPHLAPDVLEWYYAATQQTGKDYFILPPSGHLYAYPSSLNAEDQDRFVAATENDARLLDVRSVVHWDWLGTWRDAEEVLLPKYARAGVIQGVFPLNVPYLLPAFDWWASNEFFRVLPGERGGEVVVFRPQSWRGVDDRDGFFLSPQNQADRLAAFPPGTVTWVYMTSDGGLNLDNSFNALVPLLPPHVQLVSADAAARLARVAARR